MSTPANTPSITTINGQGDAPVEDQHFKRWMLTHAERTTLALEALSSGAGSTDAAALDQAAAASKVIKGSAGSLKSLSVYNSGAAQFILIMNAASLPANGAVTLLYPPIPIAAASILMLEFARPLVASTGIVVCNSSTAPSKTIGAADCQFHAQYN